MLKVPGISDPANTGFNQAPAIFNKTLAYKGLLCLPVQFWKADGDVCLGYITSFFCKSEKEQAQTGATKKPQSKRQESDAGKQTDTNPGWPVFWCQKITQCWNALLLHSTCQ